MPADQWNIPYIYPSKKTAGVTGAGQGFNWEQANNFRDDEEDGFLRLGKETDDCELIDLATGTWEFPYLTDGDGLSMSGPTGHHSGGETHGCEGFTYMCDGKFDINPPSFRFRKETYHVQCDTDPQTGVWTSPHATGPIANRWKGAKWIRYNKKDGIGPGKDSVVLEFWWNDNPESDIKNWVMLKRTEDKGAGITNWGVGATCDGDAYQVGTWSNIQFRFKSSSSDFSLHPLIPETNEGENVHSIGGADMSFSDSAARGYGKRADMPRDIEMTCLFKWDAGGRGKCHFKNISLREIDPSISFEADPETPPVEEEPGETTTLRGNFLFKQDINHIRGSGACAGSGGGGGGGTSSEFYTLTADEDNDKELSDSSTFDNRTRIAQKVTGSGAGAILNNKKPLLFEPDLKVSDVTIPSTPVISAKIWDSDGNVLYTSPTTFDPSTLLTTFAKKTFDFSTNTHIMVPGDYIGVEYTGTSSSKYVLVKEKFSSSYDPYSCISQYEGGAWEDKSTRDLAAHIWA